MALGQLPTPIKATNDTRIYIFPTLSRPNTNLNFTISVKIENAPPMNTFQVYLSWDPKLLYLASPYSDVKEGTFLNNQTPSGKFDTFPVFVPNNTRGLLQYWDTQIPRANETQVETAVSGNGTLFTVKFTVNSTGQCPLHLFNTGLSYLGTADIPHTTTDGSFDNEKWPVVFPDQHELDVITKSNSSVCDFDFSFYDKRIMFVANGTLNGTSGIGGYVNVTIPKDLLDIAPATQWWVMFDGVNTTSFTATTDGNSTFIYMTYTQSRHNITIIGNEEYPYKIYVTPSALTLGMTLDFTVDVNVEMVYQADSYNVSMQWDPVLLEATTVTQGSFLSNNSQIPTTFTFDIDNVLGTLEIQEVQTGGSPPGVGGNGTLFSIAFLAIGTGQCALHPYNTSLRYSSTEISHSALDGHFNNELYTVTFEGVGSFDVSMESNSAVYAFGLDVDGKAVFFNVSGPASTSGHVNVTIPKALLNINATPNVWSVLFDSSNATFTYTEDSDYTYVYVTYTHSEHYVRVIGTWMVPEYPVIWLPLLAVAALAALLFVAIRYRRFPKMSKRYQF
jgi:hypothetical protein